MQSRAWFVGVTLFGVLFTQVQCQSQLHSAPLPVPPTMEDTIATSPAKAQLSSLTRQRRWKEAIVICKAILKQHLNEVQILDEETAVETKPAFNEWNWRATVGELYLLDLQPKVAATQFGYIRRYAPKAKTEGNSSLASAEVAETFEARLRAGKGIARAYAEMGQWPQSLAWLKQSDREELETHWCGNCAEGVAIRTYPTQEAWKKASLSPLRSVAELKKIVHGQFKPLRVQLNPQRGVDVYQKNRATREAALLLGEAYLRRGKQKQARAMFQKASEGPYLSNEFYLAKTYLDCMS